MTFLAEILAFALVLAAAPARGQDASSQLRFLSRATRDRLPTADEARAFYAAGDKPAALDAALAGWLGEPAHGERIERYFHDMFGIEPFVFVGEASLDLIAYDAADAGEAPADLHEAGVYYLPKDVKAGCGTPVSAAAWWSDQPVRICPSAVSAAIVYDGGAVYCPDPFSANGMRNAQCGCGPEEILCVPRAQKGQVIAGVVREFAGRGRHAYETGGSWLDLLGGSRFYGDRWLYFHYLYQERVVAKGQAPTAAEMAVLHALPVDGGKAEAELPGEGPERAGVATAPAFLRRFNNFRSRVRALTERLLCHDVDGSLNTDGIQEFVNGDLSAFDKQHGDEEACATCHFGMDNMGSSLLGWTADGFFEAFPAKSQKAHVFGQDGTGPRFLIESYVLRGEGFAECMAKRAWEDFSGVDWTALAEADRAAFVAAAADGPRGAIRTILTSVAFKELRARKYQAVASAPGAVLDFAADVQPILARSCDGAACHGADNVRNKGSAYVGNEALLKGAPAARIGGGSMPPAGSGMALSDEERAVLVRWIGQ